MLDVSDKGESHSVMETAAFVAHVKGTNQSQTVVKERVSVMGLGESGYMSYRRSRSVTIARFSFCER